MTSEKLSNAVELIKSGNKQAALPILQEILRANPQEENAWLWLYACVDNVEQRKYCLQKALEINPGNQQARNALGRLTDPISQPVRRVVSVKEMPPALAANRNRRPWLFALGAIFLVFLCVIVPFLYLFQSGQISALAANLPLLAPPTSTFTATPSLTPTFTLTVTPSPSRTFTPTATRRPSATFMPELETPTFPPTTAPFTPGNPTATSRISDITDTNFINGWAAYKAQQYQTAIDLMSTAIQTNPELAPAYRYRGMAYQNLNHCELGLADFNKALSIDPSYGIAWFERGTINDCLGNMQAAALDYQKALSLDGSLAFAHHNLGVFYYKMQNYPKSLDEFSLAVAIDPSRSDSWSGKSESLARLGQYDECVESANKALQANAKQWLAYEDRAGCESAQKKFDAALKDYTIYADHQPDDPYGPYNIGVAHSERGDSYFILREYDKAIADYKIAVSLVRGDAHSYCQLSYSYFEVKQYQNAIKAGKSSIAINPACGGQRLLEVIARSAYALKDYDQALTYINQALGMGTNPLDYYYRGLIYQGAGRNSEAIQDLKYFLSSGYGGAEVDDAKARLAKLEP